MSLNPIWPCPYKKRRDRGRKPGDEGGGEESEGGYKPRNAKDRWQHLKLRERHGIDFPLVPSKGTSLRTT